MKKIPVLLSRYLISITFPAILFLAGSHYLTAQSLSLSAVSDMARIFEDGYRLPPLYDTLILYGIRGETISGQVAIMAKKSVTGITVKIGALRNETTGSEIPSGSVTWNFVGSVPLTKNTPNQPPDVLSRTAPARFPDYLSDEKVTDLKSKSIRSVWITITIPENTEEGTYNCRLSASDGKEEQYLPLAVNIYPLTLPSERHLKVVEWHNTSGFGRFHGIKEKYSKEWFDMLGKYAENMVAHRQNIFQVPMDNIEIERTESGELIFDFMNFDRISEVFWNTGKMDYLETGFLANFGKDAWFSTEIILRDFRVRDALSKETFTLKGAEVVPYLLPAFESHLREKGWINKTLFHIRDEPSVHNAVAWKEMSQYIHKYAPDLVRIDAIETTFLLDDIEIAVPKLDHFATWYDSYKEWKLKGNELWFYTVGIYQGSRFPDKTIDMPLIDSRIMHWINYKYDASGYLHWGYNQWNDDPFNDTGEHIGDGWHVYPSKEGVLNSLRWEQMRNGIQDYEYLWMLENKTSVLKAYLGSRFSWIDPKQRGKEIASQVVKGFADHTDDPETLLNARNQIIKEILSFDASPGLFIQTNPCEGSIITSGSTVEVLGWTDPGTTIIVNGKELPVSVQGLFLEQFQLTAERNSIIVHAAGPEGKKEIKRTFVIKSTPK